MDRRPSLLASRADLDLARWQLATKPDKRAVAATSASELLPSQMSFAVSDVTLAAVFPGLESSCDMACSDGPSTITAFWDASLGLSYGFGAVIAAAIYSAVSFYGSPLETPQPVYQPGCEGAL